jgi:hypothetical protein
VNRSCVRPDEFGKSIMTERVDLLALAHGTRLRMGSCAIATRTLPGRGREEERAGSFGMRLEP